MTTPFELDLPDETMAELQAIAAKTGQSVEEVAVDVNGVAVP